MKIEHGTWVIVADGAKYLAMRNIGDDVFLQLEVVAQETSDQPAARDLASDRPGRRNDASRATPDGVVPWGRSAMEQTDWHARAEMDFAVRLAQQLGAWAAAKRFQKLVVIAAPHVLGLLRAAWDQSVAAMIIAEIDKDLTGLPVPRIETVLTGIDA
ncbi:baeRF12 domain-containing protein [Roseicyclus sp.]|uniref:baeRF12 domain-containing protein n=1 Tax=Roseicyclus sp. TaxID=1914329 RepID=UPI003F6CE09B